MTAQETIKQIEYYENEMLSKIKAMSYFAFETYLNHIQVLRNNLQVMLNYSGTSDENKAVLVKEGVDFAGFEEKILSTPNLSVLEFSVALRLMKNSIEKAVRFDEQGEVVKAQISALKNVQSAFDKAPFNGKYLKRLMIAEHLERASQRYKGIYGHKYPLTEV